MAMGAKFAGPAAVSLYNARLLVEARHRAEQLQRALGSRSVVDQASVSFAVGPETVPRRLSADWSRSVSPRTSGCTTSPSDWSKNRCAAPATAKTDPDSGYQS
jgi:hypothetical protein